MTWLLLFLVHHNGASEQLLEITGTIPVIVKGKWAGLDTVREGVWVVVCGG